MKKAALSITLLAAVCVVGFLLWKIWGEPNLNPQKQNSFKVPEAPSSQPTVKYPVTPASNEKIGTSISTDTSPIPKLDESDKPIQQRLKDLFENADFEDVLIFDNFIRHFVIAIDNATGSQIPAASSPIKTAPGELSVKKSGSGFILVEKNYKRYGSYIKLAQSANLRKIVGYYRRLYPLFQSAYKDLGTSGNFNDKLIEAIDNLLETPEVHGPIRLKSQSVRYEFVDPSLESLSAIQKILIRMGPDNSKILRSKFKELRGMLSQLGS